MTISSSPVSLALAVVVTACAINASAGQAAPWPQANPQHQAFFCGADNAAETAPPGYAKEMLREISSRGAKGMDVPAAIEDLRSTADCAGAIARGALPAEPAARVVKVGAKQ